MVTVENHIGKINITESYLTEIIHHTVCNCFGVADVCSINAFQSAVSSLTGGKLCKSKGVVVYTDKNGGLYIDLHIKVTYGTNISAAVSSITHKVMFTVEQAIDLQVKDVNVYVDDMSY